MELSVFGAFTAQGAAAKGLQRGSEADSDGNGFAAALGDCMGPDGSAAPGSEDGDGVQADAPEGPPQNRVRFHDMRKKPCEDTGEGNGLDPEAPLEDAEPLEGATLVKNADPRPAVAGMAPYRGRRPVDPAAQAADKVGADAHVAPASPLMAPLHAEFGIVSSASADTSGFAPAPVTIYGDGGDGLSSLVGLAGRAGKAVSREAVVAAPAATSAKRGDVQTHLTGDTEKAAQAGTMAEAAVVAAPVATSAKRGDVQTPLTGDTEKAVQAGTMAEEAVVAAPAATSAKRDDVQTPLTGDTEKAAQAGTMAEAAVVAAPGWGAADDAGDPVKGVLNVEQGNASPALYGQAAEDNAQAQGEGDDRASAGPQAVKRGFARQERHGMIAPGALGGHEAPGAGPAMFDTDSGAAPAASPAAQGGSFGSGGSAQGDGKGLEDGREAEVAPVNEAGRTDVMAFVAEVDKTPDKTGYDPSMKTDGRTQNAAASNDIYDRLGSGLRLAVTRGAREVSITLHPEHLGAIRIRLNMDDPAGNAVSARITVESMEVKGVLDADAGTLKEAFSRQGLKLDGYTIELAKNAFGAGGGDGYHQNGAAAWWGGGTGGFRDGPSNRGAGGWAVRNGEINEGVNNNGPTPRPARHGGVGSNAVDVFA